MYVYIVMPNNKGVGTNARIFKGVGTNARIFKGVGANTPACCSNTLRGASKYYYGLEFS
jgi:hypothetical protein